MALSRVCIVLGLLALGVYQTSGKGFFCRDPDTGKLHDVNSTWPSTTFCGNYTCKLRKKGPAETQYIPIRQFKVANVNISDIITRKSKTLSEVIFEKPEKQENEHIESKTEKHNSDEEQYLEKNEILPVKINTEDEDRYLNESEIKTIAHLLQGIKKSDLAAIVDIYNLAKDIHKETGSVPSKNIIDKTVNAIKDENENIDKGKNNKQNSYWYDPIHDQNKNKKNSVDMVYQGSNIAPAAFQIPEADSDISYFKGTLTKRDFRKLPYYYPMSNFQRESSYSYPYIAPQNLLYSAPRNLPYSVPQNPLQSVPEHQPCQVKSCSLHYPNSPGISQGANRVLMKPFPVETAKKPQPILLPYPYSYIQHYNSTSAGYYYDRNLWALIDMYNKYNSYYKPYYIANKAVNSNTAPKEENLVEKFDKTENLIKSLITKTQEHIKTASSWQSPPIANDVLEDVRAHIQDKTTILKPFPLRKKVKVEKVGKVINLDELKRSKRSTMSEEELDEKESEIDDNFEAYVERTTCDTDNIPGYFRMGNLTELYPACCPQRINEKTT